MMSGICCRSGSSRLFSESEAHTLSCHRLGLSLMCRWLRLLPAGPVSRPVRDPLPVEGGLSESEVSLSVGGEGLESDAVVGLGVVAPACVPGDLSGDSTEPLGQAGTSPCRDGPSLGAADSCAGGQA